MPFVFLTRVGQAREGACRSLGASGTLHQLTGTGFCFATVLCLFVLFGAGCAQSGCQRPTTPEQGFSCSANDIQVLRLYDPQTWWQLSNPPDSYVGALDFIKNYFVCCRICVWSLEYPSMEPIVVSSGEELDCVKFRLDFENADVDSDGKLRLDEFSSYMDQGPNPYLAKKGFLDGNYTFRQTDLNRDTALSLEEYLVLRHFWAIAHTTRTGPLAKTVDGRQFADGALGGLFVDELMIKVWYTTVVGLSLELYLDRFWDTSAVREPVPQELRSAIRSMDLDGSTKISLEEHYFRVFADRDSDGYLSRAEYYQSLFSNCHPVGSTAAPSAGAAAVTADGAAEATAQGDCELWSQPTQQLVAGGRDSPYLFDYNFRLHDINRDGRVSFLERKFFAADTNVDLRISAEEFLRADFPARPGSFQDHARVTAGESEPSIDLTRYLHYAMLHECASLGRLEYGLQAAAFPWSRTCVLDLRLSHLPPFVQFEVAERPVCLQPPCSSLAADAHEEHRCSSDGDCASFRACSYFGFCHNLTDVEPLGPFKRFLALQAPPSGYAFKVWEEIASRQNWNYTLSPSEFTSPDGFDVLSQRKIFSLGDLAAPTIPQAAGWCCDYDFELRRCRIACPAANGYGAENKPVTPVGLFTAFKHSRYQADATTVLDSTGYVCSPNLWQDGFVIIVPASQSATSYPTAMLKILYSQNLAPSFYSFLAADFFVTLLFGLLIWALERGHPTNFFKKNAFEGLWDGLWFGFVTQSTVGYGDKAPATWAGKLLTALWIVFSLILFSVLLSEVVSSMETGEQEREKSMIVDLDGLKDKRVGVLLWTQYQSLSKQYQFSVSLCDSMAQCIRRLEEGEVDAMVVPGSDAAHYVTSDDFQLDESADCPSPIKVVGEPVLQSNPVTGTQNTICFCRSCSAAGQQQEYNAYLARYLMDAVEVNLKTLAAEGVLDNLQEDYLSDYQAATRSSCSNGEDLFNWTEISVCLATIVFMFICRRLVVHKHTGAKIDALDEWRREQWQAFLFRFGLKAAEKDPHSNLTEEEKEELIVAGEATKWTTYTSNARYSMLDRYFMWFTSSAHTQGRDVANLQEELVRSRVKVTHLVALVTNNLGVVTSCIVVTTACLIIVWGTQVPIDKMGAAPGSEERTSSEVVF